MNERLLSKIYILIKLGTLWSILYTSEIPCMLSEIKDIKFLNNEKKFWNRIIVDFIQLIAVD